MTGCCANGCSNRSERGFRMYRFPADPARRKTWEDKVGRVGWKARWSSFLCQAHFEESQFENGRADGKKKLKRLAAPTVFPDYRSPSAKKSSKRRHATRIPHPVNSSSRIPALLEHTYCMTPQEETTSASTEESVTEERAAQAVSADHPERRPPSKVEETIRRLKAQLQKTRKQNEELRKAKTDQEAETAQLDCVSRRSLIGV